MPMAYGEVFVPFVADGLLFRFGRYITLPDFEAQLAPNDYLYTRSITYSVDNYSTTGLNARLAVNRN
jgi:Putative beta-barrel porin-2, OmpL-like. bbp2